MRYKQTNLVTSDRRKTAGRWLNKGAGLTDAFIKGVQIRLPGHGDSGPTLEIFHYARHLPQPPLVANRLGFGHIAFEVATVAATRKTSSPWRQCSAPRGHPSGRGRGPDDLCLCCRS